MSVLTSLKHDVSETEFCLRLQVEPALLGSIERSWVLNKKQEDG
jgi:hypothetical protein